MDNHTGASRAEAARAPLPCSLHRVTGEPFRKQDTEWSLGEGAPARHP